MSDNDEDGPPAKRQKMEEQDEESKYCGPNEKQQSELTEDTFAGKDDSTMEDKCSNLVTQEELEKLKEFKILDEAKSDDENSSNDSEESDGISEEEIEKMLEKDLPEDFKATPKPKEKQYVLRSKIVLEEKGTDPFELLPLDWICVRHASGLPIYMHRPTRVVTFAKPYCLGKSNIQRHDIPISAIPCLAYRKALEEEEKQKEIDKKIQEQVEKANYKLKQASASNKGKEINSKGNLKNRCPFTGALGSKTECRKYQNNNIKKNYECDRSSFSEDIFCNEASNNKEQISSEKTENKRDTYINDTANNILENVALCKEVTSKENCKKYISSEKYNLCDTKSISSDKKIDMAIDFKSNKDDKGTIAEPKSNIDDNTNADEKCHSGDGKNAIEKCNIGDNTNAVDKLNSDNNTDATEKPNSESKCKSDDDDVLPLHMQPVILPGGVAMPPPRVENVSTSWKTQHLTYEQINDYCKRLFKFKTVVVTHFKRWVDRRNYTKARKALQYPTLLEGTKLITIPNTGKENGKGKRDWVMNMNGRCYLSVFHEYVYRALQKQPVYEFTQLENASNPYQATVYIGDMQYGVGYGSSKRQAKANAARSSIQILIPEMSEEGAAPSNDEPDFTFFNYVGVEDPRVSEFCAATCEPSPHAILRTCLLRNFGANDRHIAVEMKKLEFQKIQLTMKVGKHSATVVCKNKKAAKQRASQAILQSLHPHIRSWGSLLRMYGSRSIKSCKEKKLEEQQITLLQDKARRNEPNHAVLQKLRDEMTKLRQRDESVVPIGTLMLTEQLPTHSGSNLNNVHL
ncbi:microprocessor complex subunit DGCR8 [Leptidea sinapis]|uniref:microprocessor complex subunit DGCR8 n=1 Tax=Leptidea sinapis TaxID=189913 RepID=UPI002128040C|nr:microprocessor complex subunit DGCR8 [Leptidea sinapis]XP_050669011.1 microprocessor complex subunit DGCR8 [Leptidea sinapis]XP_050669085.1 microprocessor complex subunit DGCR8 [Leptidea sinapis]